MTRQVEFPLEGGGGVFVEVDDPQPRAGLERAGAGTGSIERVQQTLQDALAKIKPAAASIIDIFRELRDSPDEVTVEFGVKLTAEANVILSKAALEGNYKITLKWGREKKLADQPT